MSGRREMVMLHEDAGLVGTPYFRAGIAVIVAVWAVLMLALWY